MNCGILIIGSLLWDDVTEGRKGWRSDRLDLSKGIRVKVPIAYGRKSSSRANTFTMVLQSESPMGTGILVPCRRDVATIDDLVAEASALWKAEAPNATPGALGSTWGSVGVLFQGSTSNKVLAESWRAHFEKTKTSARGVVQSDGSLNVPWPTTEESAAVNFDLILATATVPEPVVPSPEAVAKAILNQEEGHENYFLNNVFHGIRTASDEEIFTIINGESPNWISAEKYRDAIRLLGANPGAA